MTMPELNSDYSTTRLVTREVPIIEEPLDAAIKTVRGANLPG